MAKFKNERQRSKGKARKIDTRKELIKILIVCEGEKTEPEYFRAFPVRADVNVILDGGAGNTIGLVERARELIDKSYRLKPRDSTPDPDMDYDQVWCVFDRDSFPNGHFNTAIQMAESSGFYCAYTNEAFEFWYIIHFEFHATAYSRDQYKSLLTDRLGYEYRKNDKNIYSHLVSRQPRAIKNAARLITEYGNTHNPEGDNPCTTVHELVQVLNKYLRSDNSSDE